MFKRLSQCLCCASDHRSKPVTHSRACQIGACAVCLAGSCSSLANSTNAVGTKKHTKPTLVSDLNLEHPHEAILDGICGTVEIQLQINAAGEVTSAKVISGPEVFHRTAEQTALSLRFEPAMNDGQAVSGQALLRFEYTSNCAGDSHNFEMVIEETDLGPPETRSVEHLTEAELRRSTSQDLGETVAVVPGVTMAGGSGDTTKPIIRGLTERRLLLIVDGVRHESQKWGADHAPEIDPNSAGRITVIKGASGVRYGPDALAGVILVEPSEIRTEKGVGGNVKSAFSTNGRRAFGAARIDSRFEQFPHLGLRVEGNYQRGAAISTPNYILGNTGSETWNGGTTLQYCKGQTALKLRYQHFDQTSGVYYGIANSTPDDFNGQLDRTVPLTAHLWETTTEIDRPYQDVSHDLALARFQTALGSWGDLDATYAFQRNHREEYDHARNYVTGPQYDFLLRTHTLNIDLSHMKRNLGSATLQGEAGFEGSFQENVYSGYTLIPNYRSYGGGLFAYERMTWDQTAIDVGARIDHLSRSSFLEERFYENHIRRETIEEGDCDTTGTRARCPSDFNAFSLSLGGLWQIIPEHIELKVDVSSASRAPNADEAYMLSSAPTMPIYVYSDPSLDIETTWGASPTIGIEYPWIQAEVSGYANYITDYIYFAPELGEDGTPALDVTIRGTFPRYNFSAIDAQFHGMDGSIILAPDGWISLGVQGSAVRAIDTETREFLVGIPPDRMQVSVKGQWADLGPLRDLRLEVSVETIAEQTRVNSASDFAPAPAGANLLHASFGSDLQFGSQTWSWGIEGHNLLNTVYRDYTSLLRYYADQPGRDVRLHVSTDF